MDVDSNHELLYKYGINETELNEVIDFFKMLAQIVIESNNKVKNYI